MVRKPFLSNHYLVKDYIKSMVVEEGHVQNKTNKQTKKPGLAHIIFLLVGYFNAAESEPVHDHDAVNIVHENTCYKITLVTSILLLLTVLIAFKICQFSVQDYLTFIDLQ